MSIGPDCKKIEDELRELFAPPNKVLSAREDARAFGAKVERMIADFWPSLCKNVGAELGPPAGRKTIFDISCNMQGQFFGVDVKTKDLDKKKYADGGVCSIYNLVRFLVKEKGVFVIAEVCHEAGQKPNRRRISSIVFVPIHFLPTSMFKVENLGTGQVRLKCSLKEMRGQIDRKRKVNEFLGGFSEIAIQHYKDVSKKAKNREAQFNNFVSSGFKDIPK